jgi:hypothetical protein
MSKLWFWPTDIHSSLPAVHSSLPAVHSSLPAVHSSLPAVLEEGSHPTSSLQQQLSIECGRSGLRIGGKFTHRELFAVTCTVTTR